MILTHTQMLAQWRRAMGFETDRTDCTIESTEGIDTTAAHATAMRRWYVQLLDSGPLTALITHDVASRVSATSCGSGTWALNLPPDVRRIISITTETSDGPVPVLADDTVLPSNPYLRGCAQRPIAVARGREVLIYCTSAPAITSVRAVTDPGDEAYEMDESALQLLPRSDPFDNY